MELKRIINIEDNAIKQSKLTRELNRNGISEIYWAKDAKSGIEEIERAVNEGVPYDLLICDMHFDFFGELTEQAGRKTLDLLRQKGIQIPVIFFSSIDVNIPGSAGSVWFWETQDWEGALRRELENLNNNL